MKKLAMCFGFGLIVGTITANILKMGSVQELMNYRVSLWTINRAELFFYIWKQRIVSLLVIWLMSLTIFCKPVLYGYSTYCGFSAGVMISMLTMDLGIKSILVYIGLSCPHGMVYLVVWLILIAKSLEENLKFEEIDAYGRKKSRKPQLIRWGTFFLILVVIFSIGVGMETFLSPWIVSKVLTIL